MRNHILALVLSCFIIAPTFAYSFSTKMNIEVVQVSHVHQGKHFEIRIVSHDKEAADAYPIGSILSVSVSNSQGSDLINDAQTIVYVRSINLPDGNTTEVSNEKLVLRGFSKYKSELIPFYRLAKLLEGSAEQQPRSGKKYILKKAKPGKTLYAVPL
jgi:hypothetical protein